MFQICPNLSKLSSEIDQINKKNCSSWSTLVQIGPNFSKIPSEIS